jgi:Protein of unknown function (DUF2950)
MESNMKNTPKWKEVVIGMLMLAGLAAAMVLRSETKTSARAQAQATFESQAEAGAALANAARNVNGAEVDKILGASTRFLLSTGDRQADQTALQAFATKYDKMNRWVDMTDGSALLYIGVDNFAFPVPLAKNASGEWYFDAVAGAEEVRAREIGRNELLAIDACSALADAQEAYFAKAGDSGAYAQRIISSSGKQDGLYWPASEKENSSPLANLSEILGSSLTSLTPDQPLVIDGYSLRILTAQGNEAPGGAKSHVVNGKMTGGFAILATPVKYGETGILTFMTGRDGVVYERDLGPDTATIAAHIQEFNPTVDWSPVE